MPDTGTLTVAATIGLLEAGRRHAVHRTVTVNGVTQSASERCNLDSAEHRRVIARGEVRGKPCRWCFPKGLPD